MRPFEVPWKYAPGLIDAAIELNAAECFSRVYIHTSSSLKHVCVRTHWHIWIRTHTQGHCQLLQGLPFETWADLVKRRICVLFVFFFLLLSSHCAKRNPLSLHTLITFQDVGHFEAPVGVCCCRSSVWCWSGMFTEVFTFSQGVWRSSYIPVRRSVHHLTWLIGPFEGRGRTQTGAFVFSPLTQTLGSIIDGCCDSSCLTLLSSNM